LTDKYWRKDNLACHSERSEESPTFIEFLTQRIKINYKALSLLLTDKSSPIASFYSYSEEFPFFFSS